MPQISATVGRDTYLYLVRRFPLRRLRSTTEHAEALDVLRRVSLKYQDTRDRGVLDYLDVLAGLIDQYETEARLKAETSHRAPGEIIRHLMAAGGLSVSRLARETGIRQSNLSEMLSGRRDFSKTAIAKLCSRFGLSPAVFFRASSGGDISASFTV
jgi:antitoxin component HigA of HigAB toxin-antitoxin module